MFVLYFWIFKSQQSNFGIAEKQYYAVLGTKWSSSHIFKWKEFGRDSNSLTLTPSTKASLVESWVTNYN